MGHPQWWDQWLNSAKKGRNAVPVPLVGVPPPQPRVPVPLNVVPVPRARASERLDALELKDLSEALQATDITIYRAVRMISRQIEVFVYRKSECGTAYSEAQNMLWLMVRLKKLHLSRLAGSAEIDRARFYHP